MSLFLDYRDIIPELKVLSDNFELIHKEFISAKDSLDVRDFSDQQDDYISRNKRGFPIEFKTYMEAKQTSENKGWHMGAICYHGISNPFNAPYLLFLNKIISSIDGILVAGLNVLHPGASLDWHNDRDYGGGASDTYRVLWGIDVPLDGDKYSIFQMKDSSGNIETKIFENNQFYAFNPNTTHRVENMMTKPRTVIAMDVIPTKDMKNIKNKGNLMFKSVLEA